MLDHNDETRLATASLLRMGRLLYRQGYLSATDGNLSVRLADGSLLVTASGVHKGFLTAADIVRLDAEGAVLDAAPGKRPSSETALHLACYRLREDVHGVIHAHPPEVIAASVAGVPLDEPVLPEMLFYLGTIPTAPYALPSSPEGPEKAAPLIPHHDAIVLARHGSLTLGQDLWTAFLRLENLVGIARTLLLARQCGTATPLTPAQIDAILAHRRALGLPPFPGARQDGQA